MNKTAMQTSWLSDGGNSLYLAAIRLNAALCLSVPTPAIVLVRLVISPLLVASIASGAVEEINRVPAYSGIYENPRGEKFLSKTPRLKLSEKVRNLYSRNHHHQNNNHRNIANGKRLVVGAGLRVAENLLDMLFEFHNFLICGAGHEGLTSKRPHGLPEPNVQTLGRLLVTGLLYGVFEKGSGVKLNREIE